MADKLAVIQSEETVAELTKIDGKTKKLVSTFQSLVEITDKINYGFGKGTPKEYIKAINEAAAIQKKYEQALNDVAKAQSEVERLQKKIKIIVKLRFFYFHFISKPKINDFIKESKKFSYIN